MSIGERHGGLNRKRTNVKRSLLLDSTQSSLCRSIFTHSVLYITWSVRNPKLQFSRWARQKKRDRYIILDVLRRRSSSGSITNYNHYLNCLMIIESSQPCDSDLRTTQRDSEVPNSSSPLSDIAWVSRFPHAGNNESAEHEFDMPGTHLGTQVPNSDNSRAVRTLYSVIINTRASAARTVRDYGLDFRVRGRYGSAP